MLLFSHHKHAVYERDLTIDLICGSPSHRHGSRNSRRHPPPDPLSLPHRSYNLDHKLPHVPGTVLLNDEAAHSEALTGGLKHGTGKNSHIVLAPQPSEDPNDPLNWSSWKKEIVTYILCFGAMLNAATIGPLLNSSIVVIATDLNRSITDVVVISGYNLLAVGASGYHPSLPSCPLLSI